MMVVIKTLRDGRTERDKDATCDHCKRAYIKELLIHIPHTFKWLCIRCYNINKNKEQKVS
jgi:hypothetical protein